MLRPSPTPNHALCMVLLLVGGSLVTPRPLAGQASAYEQLQRFSAVLNHIRLNYVDTVTYAELVSAAIEGMLRSLDPHSYFVSRRDWEMRSALERGELGVSGMVLDEEEGVATAEAVVPESPAAKAGVLPGDRLVQINDTSVVGLEVAKVELLLARSKGTKVRVTLERGPRLEPESLSVTLKLRPLDRMSVGLVRMAGSVTAYLRLGWFGTKADEELHRALKQLERSGAQQVILDLRDNPGGMVDAAVEIASEFFPEGTLVFRTRGRKVDANRDFVTKRTGDFASLPLVVLVNERSASASEALAGAMQDHDRALLLGRRTFGKALEQTGFLLVPTGDVVELTVAHVETPSGRVIQRHYKGISVEQYQSFAGKSGAAADTVTRFHTDHGREVRGGGGIAPDITTSAPATYPVWWSVAVDSGLASAVADSVARSLPGSDGARAAWAGDPARWRRELLDPFLAHVRTVLHVRAEPDTAVASRLALLLAVRVADVRWPPDGGAEVFVGNDPDIRAAASYFPRLGELLAGPK